ncbi:MAG TPA: hypothetical protein VGE44_00290 [Daejeonella sp.]|uniref:hypothetical protein n=1 Tax=Daejeonella sp. TaxID=2805397 RepID=UPI002EDB8CB9
MKEEKTKDVSKKERTVESIFNSYYRNINGTELYFSKFSNLAVTEDQDEIKRSKEYIDSCFKELGLNPNSKSGTSKKEFSADKVQLFANKMSKVPKITHKNFEILANSSFLMLNNYFEYLLADLLSYYYNKYDGSISRTDLVTSLSHMNEFETIEDLKRDLIQREVESMLISMTFPELLDHFDESLKIELCKDIIDWSVIEEFRERRHLIVHNSARVNKKYITRTKNPFNLKQGDLVHIGPEYFNSALHEFKLAGYLLTLSCWGKWDKDKTTDAIYKLMTESFEALRNNEALFALRLTMYLKHIEPRSEEQEDFVLRTLFNKCIAFKILDKKAELTNELKKIKIGTASPIFKLAHAILSGTELKSILELIKHAHALKEIDLEKYSDWPIYHSLRSDSNYDEAVRKILKELGPIKIVDPINKTDAVSTKSTKKKSATLKK